MMSRLSLLALVGLLFLASPALGQEGDKAAEEEGAAVAAEEEAPGPVLFHNKGVALLGAAIGAALVIMGGAAGISRIGSAAAESMARQPEAVGSINGVAIILAAMIEGVTLFGVVVCLLVVIYGG